MGSGARSTSSESTPAPRDARTKCPLLRGSSPMSPPSPAPPPLPLPVPLPDPPRPSNTSPTSPELAFPPACFPVLASPPANSDHLLMIGLLILITYSWLADSAQRTLMKSWLLACLLVADKLLSCKQNVCWFARCLHLTNFVYRRQVGIGKLLMCKLHVYW